MFTRSLFRLSGLGLILGGLFEALGYLIRPMDAGLAFYTHPMHLPYALLVLGGSVLLVLSLPGMYAYQSARAGRFGLISFLVFYLGLAVLELGSGTLYAFVPRLLAANPDTQAWLVTEGAFEAQLGTPYMVYFLVGFLAANLGALLYGIATFRARVYPRAAAVMIAAGAPAVFLVGSLPWIGDRALVLLFAGLIWCGAWLWRPEGVPARSVDTAVAAL